MKDSRVKWASRALIGDDSVEGKDLPFTFGMDLIRPFNDDPEKWKALYRLLLQLQQMHSSRNKVKNFNADLWDGRHWSDLLLLLAEYQPLCDNLTSLCANVLKVTPQDLLMPADVDDHALTSSLLLCNPSGATRRLTGIVAQPGVLVKIENISTDGRDITLAHLADSSAPNQFCCPNAVDVTLAPNQGCWAAYDDVNSRWVLNGVPGGATAPSEQTLTASDPTGTIALDGMEIVLIDSAAAAAVTNIAEPADNTVAQRVMIYNNGAYAIEFEQGADVVTGLGGTYTLNPERSMWAHWSPTLDKWFLT